MPRPSTDEMKPTYILKSSLLYLRLIVDVNHIYQNLHSSTYSHGWLRNWALPPSQVDRKLTITLSSSHFSKPVIPLDVGQISYRRPTLCPVSRSSIYLSKSTTHTFVFVLVILSSVCPHVLSHTSIRKPTYESWSVWQDELLNPLMRLLWPNYLIALK